MDRDSRITAKTYLAANRIEALARWFCDAFPRDCPSPNPSPIASPFCHHQTGDVPFMFPMGSLESRKRVQTSQS